MILITGGGTGGHLSIAKAIAIEYNKRGIKPIYIGSTNGQDKAWFENSELFSKTIFLSSSGVVNQNFFGKIKSLLNIFKLSFHVKKIIKENGITKVFSVGGYSSAAASFGAILSKTPLFIHEQNAVMGKLNKILKPFAKEVFSSYDKNSPAKDYPVVDAWFKLAKEHKTLKTVAFLGGSQGARFINDLAKESAFWFKENGIKIVHQTGSKEYENIKEFYKKNDIEADVFSFFSPLHVKLEDVDFAVSRSGAGSMWELVAARIPALFIPYPFAAANHQYYNAKVIEKKGGCIIKTQKELDAKVLITLLCSVDTLALSLALKDIIQENGAKEIVDIIELY
ncbi:MAG: UDP-N-acetylglucosamine--N-acetylmuramyl-(pentapeptide) pyrophosphoryl-undecaprenol N-acetylglucosamine transferase [Campylobacteraceae bacterium]